jgi:hypothetical protein
MARLIDTGSVDFWFDFCNLTRFRVNINSQNDNNLDARIYQYGLWDSNQMLDQLRLKIKKMRIFREEVWGR